MPGPIIARRLRRDPFLRVGTYRPPIRRQWVHLAVIYAVALGVMGWIWL